MIKPNSYDVAIGTIGRTRWRSVYDFMLGLRRRNLVEDFLEIPHLAGVALTRLISADQFLNLHIIEGSATADQVRTKV